MADTASSRPTSLRTQMPSTAAFIDALRAAFGDEMIDAQIRKGLRGEAPAFYAEESGRSVGTAWQPGAVVPALPSPLAGVKP